MEAEVQTTTATLIIVCHRVLLNVRGQNALETTRDGGKSPKYRTEMFLFLCFGCLTLTE